MNPRKGLVLDANILMRAVLGRRVRQLLETYEDTVSFYSPDVCFDDARHYLRVLFEKRVLDAEAGHAVLENLIRMVQLVDASLYADYEQAARERIELRDADDWPVVAVALLLDLPIWTEDQDLFGSGVATWTTDRVELYLR
ncbi:MAG: PIN domain-containing protein [Terriglobia bacterium]